MRRLQSLQEQLVGGEKRNDQTLKEKRKARKQYAQSKREKLMKAVENMEDDGIMVKVYDNLQDELKIKNRKVKIVSRWHKSSKLVKAIVAFIDAGDEFEEELKSTVDDWKSTKDTNSLIQSYSSTLFAVH